MYRHQHVKKSGKVLEDKPVNNARNLKNYVKKILSNKQKLYFQDFFYKEKFGQPEYTIFYSKNKLDLTVKKNKALFLKKYLLSYNEKGKFHLHHQSGKRLKDLYSAALRHQSMRFQKQGQDEYV